MRSTFRPSRSRRERGAAFWHRPPEELAVFKELKPEIGFGRGVVDIKAKIRALAQGRDLDEGRSA